jgi:DNA-binding IclR family transcriptional regulator
MAALQGRDILYIDKVEALHAVRIESRVGKVVLKHCTGVGKAILSALPGPELEAQLATIDFARYTETTITTPEALRHELEVTRIRGYAIDDHEHEAEISCVAVPVFSATRAVIGSISVSAPSSRVPLTRLLEHLPEIRSTAAGISAALGYREAV